MLKINFKDGSVLLLAPRIHTVYPSASDAGLIGCTSTQPLLVAHFDEGPPEYVGLRFVRDICDMPAVTKLRFGW